MSHYIHPIAKRLGFYLSAIMALGILSALREEIDLLLDQMVIHRTESIGKREYYVGSIKDQKVVVVFSRWGKVASAISATELITRFNIKKLLFVGVAGGLQSGLEIGDIVIGKSFLQHDLDASPIFKKYEIPLSGQTTLTADSAIVEDLKKASEVFLDRFNEHISENVIQKFNLHRPAIVSGKIISGDQFISDSSSRSRLNTEIPDAICVEMEGAAVAQVCNDYNVSCGVLRIISDSADENAPDDFQRFILEVASRYTLEIIKAYLTRIE